MNASRINAVLTEMSADEIRDSLRYVEICERAGSMSRAEADEWRRSILARKSFLVLGTSAEH